MKRLMLTFILGAAMASACGGGDKKEAAKPVEAPAPVEKPAPPPPPEPPPPPPPKEASTTLAPTKKSKSKVTGTITFKEVEGGVEVTANVEGLKPGDHGYHVHETGDCSAADAASAGDHFNPAGHKHGGPDDEERHAGDFGNLTADKDGKASKTFVMKGITLDDAETSIVGKSFIVHAKKDDLKKQPSGNSGDRIACGVIALTM